MFVAALDFPTFYIETTGAESVIRISEATVGNCPASGPLGGTVEVIEGECP